MKRAQAVLSDFDALSVRWGIIIDELKNEQVEYLTRGSAFQDSVVILAPDILVPFHSRPTRVIADGLRDYSLYRMGVGTWEEIKHASFMMCHNIAIAIETEIKNINAAAKLEWSVDAQPHTVSLRLTYIRPRTAEELERMEQYGKITVSAAIPQ